MQRKGERPTRLRGYSYQRRWETRTSLQRQCLQAMVPDVDDMNLSSSRNDAVEWWILFYFDQRLKPWVGAQGLVKAELEIADEIVICHLLGIEE
jgi:hypothetical protein